MLPLFAGNATLCAGWSATPEERMACCKEGMACPTSRCSASDKSAL
jgi:hypothetical protein